VEALKRGEILLYFGVRVVVPYGKGKGKEMKHKKNHDIIWGTEDNALFVIWIGGVALGLLLSIGGAILLVHFL
jgi:hypothetical protein